MPLLDIDEIFTDPNFVDDFTVVRNTRTVNTSGRTVDTPGTFYTYGNIQPAREAQLKQLSDEERVGSFISVVTPFILYALTPTTAPDQVTWQGQLYRVKIVRDWSQYGSGFIEAICELVTLTEAGTSWGS